MQSNDQVGGDIRQINDKLLEQQNNAIRRNGNMPGTGMMKTGTGSQFSKDRISRTGSGDRLRSKSSTQKSLGRQNAAKSSQTKIMQRKNQAQDGNGKLQLNSDSSGSSIDGLPEDNQKSTVDQTLDRKRVQPTRKKGLREGTLAQYN